MKKNIGASLALYPVPVVVVGAMVDGKPTWTLVAHTGTVAHSHLMVSLVQAHYINKGIRETKKLSVNVVDGTWLKEADRMGTVSGHKVALQPVSSTLMSMNTKSVLLILYCLFCLYTCLSDTYTGCGSSCVPIL